jgi:hypothetical protein
MSPVAAELAGRPRLQHDVPHARTADFGEESVHVGVAAQQMQPMRAVERCRECLGAVEIPDEAVDALRQGLPARLAADQGANRLAGVEQRPNELGADIARRTGYKLHGIRLPSGLRTETRGLASRQD